ncbi:T-cell differentiation antigen CD6 isoform X2 [Takifugu rubripes]|uniref:T-cell differentiation antigen CD6 isoform X2 n=1 Tax=Takifugu rubripes TaxID=31033 RepID=UPI00114579BD|nr:T-cell differentiation antigen CD6 isoform X2 [Takifugu rubripes]
MKLMICIYIFLLSCLCQAVENFTDTDTNDPLRKKEEIIHDPYLHKFTKCNFTLKMPPNSSHDVVAMTEDSADVLLEEICSKLECGSVFHVNKSRLSHNSTCLKRCSYQDGLLQNCSLSNNNCTLIFGVVCGHRAIRLAGGSDRCAGRVELWRNGRWGTVCDDHWDLRDADVACAQLGCGYALSVTGQGGSFPPGRGPVYLDDLNCTGNEDNLWSCPAAEDESDCGHKEDAGVTCSEMRAVRLTGGLDRCSGRVEIHRNGSWGTVCDNCWNKKLASMVCSMLQCSTEAFQVSQFVPPLLHKNNDTQWFYACYGNERNLWECQEKSNKPHLCKDSKASGVICNGSLGFSTATISNSTVMTTVITGGTTPTTSAEIPSLLTSLSSTVLLSIIALFLLLVFVLVTNTVLCCHYRRRYVVMLQQKSRKGSSECYNSYQDTINLTKVTNNSLQTESHWTQPKDIDNTSVDSDYEQCTPSNPSASLITFRNSQKYKTVMTSVFNPTGAEGDFANGPSNMNEVMVSIPCSNDGSVHYARESKISVDSFDSSSTSSGEHYENSNGHDQVAPAITEPGLTQSSGTSDLFRAYRSDQLENSGNDGIGPIYSPVSFEEPSPSDEDDYDDVGI